MEFAFNSDVLGLLMVWMATVHLELSEFHELALFAGVPKALCFGFFPGR